MSDFEFLSVLVSIVIGLGLTHMLAGLGRVIHFRHQNRLDPVHMAWSVTVFLVLVLNWWVFLLWREFEYWNFATYIAVIIWTASMYVLALALYPPQLTGQVDFGEVFTANRSWFMITFTVMILLDVLTTSLRERSLPPPYYLAFVGHFAMITALGVVIKSRRYDLIAAWYITVATCLWSFGVRATLF